MLGSNPGWAVGQGEVLAGLLPQLPDLVDPEGQQDAHRDDQDLENRFLEGEVAA